MEDEDLPPSEFTPEVKAFLEEQYSHASKSPLFDTSKPIALEHTLKALGCPPHFTTVRVDRSKISMVAATAMLQSMVNEECHVRGLPEMPAQKCPHVEDVLMIENAKIHNVQPAKPEIVVGLDCAMAVLRGADVFAPGVLGMTHSVRKGEPASIWADVDKKCARGLATHFTLRKIFVGNGIAEFSRGEFFAPDGPTSGIAVKVTQSLYSCVSLPSLSLERQQGLCLQNLPSCVVPHVLDLHHDMNVLDACAAPGGKTLHVASIMADSGLVVGLERGAAKVLQ
jgi:hypothetical protein